jgi:hypothetical protein
MAGWIWLRKTDEEERFKFELISAHSKSAPVTGSLIEVGIPWNSLTSEKTVHLSTKKQFLETIRATFGRAFTLTSKTCQTWMT